MANPFAEQNIDKQFVITEVDGETKITNSELYQQSFEVTESICSEESLRFGGCESTLVKFKIKNQGISFKNKRLKVDIIVGNGKTVSLGIFKVDSDKLDANRTNREIVAYDKMYEIVNTEIAEWYNGLIFPITIKNFREQLFDYIGCEQREIELPNDDELICSTPFFDSLFCGDVLKDICEINGCFGKMGNDDVFDYVFLEKTTSSEIAKAQYGYGNLTYEDYETQKIDGVVLVQSNSETEFHYNAEGENLYTIETRALFFGEKEETVIRLLEKMHGIIGDLQYVPMSIKCLNDLNRKCGSKIKVYTREGIEIKSYVLERNISGTQILKDSIEARGTEYYEKRQSGTDRAIYYANKQITDVYKSLFYSYTFTNAQKYNFSSKEETIIEFNVAATAETDVIFVATIPVELSADGELIVRYYVDAVEIENTMIKTYLHEGASIVTVSNYISMGENDRLSLKVSAEMAYRESVERKHSAKILSFENYIQTGEYNELEVDKTVPDASIEQWGIKAVLFAKGLAGTSSWDGTLNFADAIEKIAVVTPQIKAFSDEISVANEMPNMPSFGVAFGKLDVAQVGIIGFDANVKFDEKVTNYTFDTSKADSYSFNADYVVVDESYHLQTNYKAISTEEEIDNGSMCCLTLRTDDKSSIESVVI